MIFLTSDLHLGHDAILQFEPKRQIHLGTTIKEHDENLIKRINLKVKTQDTLIILGDFSLRPGAEIAEYRRQILCENIILILGNHDGKTSTYYSNCGFSLVCYEMVLKISGEFVRLRHHPYRKPWHKTIFPWQFKEKDRKKRPIDHGHFLLHGHSHTVDHPIRERQINVGCDNWKYYPISIKDIEGIVSRQIALKNNKRRSLYPCIILKKMMRWMRILLRRSRKKTSFKTLSN